MLCRSSSETEEFDREELKEGRNDFALDERRRFFLEAWGGW